MNIPFQPHILYYGDCLEIMEDFPDNSIDLVCLAPPFNSTRTYETLIGSEAVGAAFKDTLTLSNLNNARCALFRI